MFRSCIDIDDEVIDMALLGSSKEPISYIISWSNLGFPDGIVQAFIVSLIYKLIFLISTIYLLLGVAL